VALLRSRSGGEFYILAVSIFLQEVQVDFSGGHPPQLPLFLQNSPGSIFGDSQSFNLESNI
jgi:hypothetical protein